jgi:hypothetical protein
MIMSLNDRIDRVGRLRCQLMLAASAQTMPIAQPMRSISFLTQAVRMTRMTDGSVGE